MDFIGVTTGTTTAVALAKYPHVAIVPGLLEMLDFLQEG